MRTLTTILRLLPLAGAALASVATSSIGPQYESWVTSATPVAGETAVSANVVPVVQMRLGPEEAKDKEVHLELRDASGGAIAGTPTLVAGAEPDTYVYTFHPDAPLPAGDYVLLFAGGSWAEHVEILDYHLHYLQRPNGTTYGSDVSHFSTVSRPDVRATFPLGGAASVLVEFTQDMDVTTLEHVNVLDATGDVLPATRTWRADEQHTLELAVGGPGAVSVELTPGLLAADGTPVPGLPKVIDVPLP